MTLEELRKIPFHFECHLNMEGEHCTTYASEDGRIKICDHVPYKDGVPKGKSYRHYMLDGKVFKKWDKFIEALKDFEIKDKNERYHT